MSKSNLKKIAIVIFGVLGSFVLFVTVVICFAVYGFFAAVNDLFGSSGEVPSPPPAQYRLVQLADGTLVDIPQTSTVASDGKISVVRVQFECPQLAGIRTFVEYRANEADARRVQCWNRTMPQNVTTSVVTGTGVQ